MDITPKAYEFYSKEPTMHRISYYEWGNSSNEKVLVCVHGLTRNARDFDFVAKSLKDNYRIIAIDIAGRGKSENLEDPKNYNYNTYVRDVLNLLSHLKLHKVDWLGTSMGGIIGMIIASTTNLINKMVLNDIGPFILADPLKRIAKYVGLNPSFNNFEEAEKHLRLILAPFGIVDNEHWRYITLHSVAYNDDGSLKLNYDSRIAEVFKGDGAIHDVDMWQMWKEIKCPILILRGKNSDILLEETAREMVKSKPNVELVEFENVGHAPALMENNQIQSIKNWLLR